MEITNSSFVLKPAAPRWTAQFYGFLIAIGLFAVINLVVILSL